MTTIPLEALEALSFMPHEEEIMSEAEKPLGYFRVRRAGAARPHYSAHTSSYVEAVRDALRFDKDGKTLIYAVAPSGRSACIRNI